MLFLTTVLDWKGVGRRDKHIIDKDLGTQYVFDITNVSLLRPWGSGSRFLYHTNPYDIRGGYDEIYCNTPYLTIKEEFTINPQSSILELPVFINNDVTKPTYTKIISIYDFSYAWAHNPYPQYSWVVVGVKHAKTVRLLVDMTLAELIALDSQFDWTNVQWYYFVDPTEVIDPSKFIRVE